MSKPSERVADIDRQSTKSHDISCSAPLSSLPCLFGSMCCLLFVRALQLPYSPTKRTPPQHSAFFRSRLSSQRAAASNGSLIVSVLL